MTSRSVRCPECDVLIRLGQAQRHCECVNCGAKFVVESWDAQEPQLTPFETLIAQRRNGISVQAVERGLGELDVVIGQAEGAVEAKHAQLEAMKDVFQARRAEVQEVVAPAQNLTYLTGLLAFVACFLMWFVLEGAGWLLALGTGIACLVLSWAFHGRWLAAEAWARGELYQLRKRIEGAETELSDAYLQLEDRVLERELRQREVAAVRSSNE
jgi:flagellar biosynthesis chaperone FliJ